MKFDSNALPLLPTPEQLNELADVLVTSCELHQLYRALENHPRLRMFLKSKELFNACQDQVMQDIEILSQQLELLEIAHPSQGTSAEVDASYADEAKEQRLDGEGADFFGVVPDLQRPAVQSTVFEMVKKTFSLEEFLSSQLKGCLRTAQGRKQLKLELQLKMALLSAEQRYKLLHTQYGFSAAKLIGGLSRKTTTLLRTVFQPREANGKAPPMPD